MTAEGPPAGAMELGRRSWRTGPDGEAACRRVVQSTQARGPRLQSQTEDSMVTRTPDHPGWAIGPPHTHTPGHVALPAEGEGPHSCTGC